MPPLKPEPDVASSTAPSAPGTPAAAPTVIRAEPGKPAPEPPHGGTWSRDPKTGDLTLVTPPTAPAEPRKE